MIFDPLRLQIYGAIAAGLVVSHGYVGWRGYAWGSKSGYERCDRANREATDRLNERIDSLNRMLISERERLQGERERRLREALGADSGKACEVDEAYRRRLNGLLQ